MALPKNPKKTFALSLFSAFITLCVADITLRHIHYPFPSAHMRYIERWPPMTLIERYEPNVQATFWSQGDLGSMTGANPSARRKIYFETDNHGFPNPPGSERATNQLDLVLLGDSFSLGVAASREKTFATLLTTKYGFAVYSLAIVGASPWHETANYLIESDRLKIRTGPQTVCLLLLFPGNDLDEPYFPIFSKEQMPWSTPREQTLRRLKTWYAKDPFVAKTRMILHSKTLSLNPTAEAHEVFSKKIGTHTLLFYGPYYRLLKRTEADIRNHKNFPLLHQSLQTLRDACASNGMRFAVGMIPSKEEVYLIEEAPSIDPWNVVMTNLCSQLNIPFYNLKPTIENSARNDLAQNDRLWWWEDDSHWNEHGHEQIATIINDLIIRTRSFKNGVSDGIRTRDIQGHNLTL